MKTTSVLLLLTCSFTSGADENSVQFGRDILPILSDRCFHCHGPEKTQRKANLRLDQRADATAIRKGRFVIKPGDSKASVLLHRVTANSREDRMPPESSHRKPLSPSEVSLITRWIDAGAVWGRHWAFEKPVRPAPAILDDHPIDSFILKRLDTEGLTLSSPAPDYTLLRRLTFTLTGLPPTVKQQQQFLADRSDNGLSGFIDHLFQSPHYGERMAMWWLDAARYSDTDGYQSDATRTNWPWRDWVIQSFNNNMPFDKFTIEQFAGDLLPDATDEQKLATCFHRNHMTNGEGGRDPEESRIDYVIDRVNTSGTVWLGLTLGCCQCHSHKFDPITQRDYYSLFAFFNSIDETGKAGAGAKPALSYRSRFGEQTQADAQRTADQRKTILEQVRRQAEQQFPSWLDIQVDSVSRSFKPWHAATPTHIYSVEGTTFAIEKDAIIQANGPNPRQDDYLVQIRPNIRRITGLKLEVFPDPSHAQKKLSRGSSGEFILTDVKLQLKKPGQSQLIELEFGNAIADVEKDAKGRTYGKIADTLDDDPRNGWTTEGHPSDQTHSAIFALKTPLLFSEGDELIFVMLHRSTVGDANIGRFRVALTDQPGQAVRSFEAMPFEKLAKILADRSAEHIDSTLKDELLEQFLTDHDIYQLAKRNFDRASQQLTAVKNAIKPRNVMVLSDRKEPRPTHILERGVWDKKGDIVTPAFPASILGSATPPSNRLDLARWIVDGNNPLTARVTVNHLWQICFGTGIVRTMDDFGLQGEFPTHPMLLDWLACELIDSDWNLQHVLKLILTSHTFAQRSDLTEELLQRDPENRLLARSPRYRRPSWMIRDAAILSSGLMNPSLGGPPLMPYQPDGVWAEMFMGRFRYEPSQGSLQYRRTVYAFWRRSSAPTFLFDSAQRRVCEVKRRETNTPIHALTLLNDLSVLESSRQLAQLAIRHDENKTSQIRFMFRRILTRHPNARELLILTDEYDRSWDHYKAHPADASALLSVGQPDERIQKAGSTPHHAALMILASMIYNLDETITRE